jgi:SagB-type dehydrogenase family enzyme
MPTITRNAGRYFLTDRIRPEIDWRNTPQARGEVPPPLQQPLPPGAELITLPPRSEWQIPPCDLVVAMARRESRRRFTVTPLTLSEVAFLLWATQGVRGPVSATALLRTVPSAGCRHPFESYVITLNVNGLAPAVYRYLPLENALVRVRTPEGLAATITAATHGQAFAANAAALFAWSVVPARSEWRYAEASYKVIALDAGHLCQNLYLACEAIGAGTCAIAAYSQELMDQLLGVDGSEEFTIYLAPVGKV